jgi:hypothetical protein
VLVTAFDVLVLFDGQTTIVLRGRRGPWRGPWRGRGRGRADASESAAPSEQEGSAAVGSAACCLDDVPWVGMETYTANGNIHRRGRFDARIEGLTKLMAAGVPHAYPETWAEMGRINAGDVALWQAVLSDALAAPACGTL